MKRHVGWFQDALRLGVPVVLWTVGSLPGVPGGGNRGNEDWIQEELAAALLEVRDALQKGRLKKAKAALEKADSLSAKLRSHTPSCERLIAKKTKLWEEYKRMKAQR